MALATLSRTGLVRPAFASRSRPLLIRAFQSDKVASEQKQELSKVSAQQQPSADSTSLEQARTRAPLSALEVLPFRRMTDVMSQMQREMDAMLDAFGVSSSDPFFSRPTSPFAMLDRLTGPSRTPGGAPLALNRVVPYDVTESDKSYTLKLEVPGFAKNDIKVSLDPNSNMLTISGEKAAKDGESQSRMSFSRSFSLPQNVDLNQDMKARTEHGVLTLELPKAEPPAVPPVKEIPVE